MFLQSTHHVSSLNQRLMCFAELTTLEVPEGIDVAIAGSPQAVVGRLEHGGGEPVDDVQLSGQLHFLGQLH